MKSTSWIPISVGLLFVVVLAFMAFTDMFQPIITFIHNENITTLQIVGCIVGAAFGFYIVFKVLVLLGGYFLPKEYIQR